MFIPMTNSITVHLFEAGCCESVAREPHLGYSRTSQTSPHPAGSLYMYMGLEDMKVFSLFTL